MKKTIRRCIILTETGAVLKGYDAQYSSEQRLTLIDADIPSTAIQVIGKHAASTREEAKLVRTLVANTDIHSLIVVTDPYHTLRTRLIWKDVFRDSGIKIIVRPARGSWYKSTSWWMSTAGWKNTINEYAKLAAYVVTQKDGLKKTAHKGGFCLFKPIFMTTVSRWQPAHLWAPVQLKIRPSDLLSSGGSLPFQRRRKCTKTSSPSSRPIKP